MIDSHFHFSIDSFSQTFSYLDENGRHCRVMKATDRGSLLNSYRDSGITLFIDPAIGMSYNVRSLELYEEYGGFFRSVGNHPAWCFRPEAYQKRIYGPQGVVCSGSLPGYHERYRMRTMLDEFADHESVVAIGETGLDYKSSLEEEHKYEQKRWFIYQIHLANRKKLPLILHIRNAAEDALDILKRSNKGLNGGVWHCFTENKEISQKFLKEFPEFTIGIGGYLLNPKYKGMLEEVVRITPLNKILLETDGPYCAPPYPNSISREECEKKYALTRKRIIHRRIPENGYIVDSPRLLSHKQFKKARNTSLTLPLVARKIADIKRVSPEEVVRVTEENTIRVFHLESRVKKEEM